MRAMISSGKSRNAVICREEIGAEERSGSVRRLDVTWTGRLKKRLQVIARLTFTILHDK